jgi:hypothetical protein
MKSLRVLVACEFSGVVRDAFTARGHDGTSSLHVSGGEWGALVERA